MLGRDHARPFADACNVNPLAIQRNGSSANALGAVSECHDAFGSTQPVARALRPQAASSPATMRSLGKGSMITPVENGNTCLRQYLSLLPTRVAGGSRVRGHLRRFQRWHYPC